MTDYYALKKSANHEHGESRPKLSAILFFATAAVGLALSIRAIMKAKYSGEDSWFPMSRALDFLHAPSTETMYQALFFSRHVKFQYPPSALLILDFGRQLKIDTLLQYNLCNAGVLIFTGILFSLFVVKVIGKVYWFGLQLPIAPIAFIVAFRFYPNNLAFEIGQMQLFLGTMFLGACYALLNDRPILAGCLIGVAGMTKPQFLPLGLCAIWRKEWAFLAGLVAAVTIFTASSIWLYGWYNHLDYLNVLRFLSRHGEYQHLNQSVGGILDRWLYHGASLDRDPLGMMPQSAFPPYIPAVYYSVVVTSLMMFAIPFVIKVRGTDHVSKVIGFCLAATLFTMASPIAWVHHFNVLLPGYVVALKGIFDRWKGREVWLAITTITLSFFLVGYPLVAASAPTIPSQNLLQSHVFIGACLLVAVLIAEVLALPKYVADDSSLRNPS